jgi:hypothetical protein
MASYNFFSWSWWKPHCLQSVMFAYCCIWKSCFSTGASRWLRSCVRHTIFVRQDDYKIVHKKRRGHVSLELLQKLFRASIYRALLALFFLLPAGRTMGPQILRRFLFAMISSFFGVTKFILPTPHFTRSWITITTRKLCVFRLSMGVI